MTASPEELADEARRMRKVRHIVDIATNLIMQSNMTRQDAEFLVGGVRQWILTVFPDGEQAYEIIYAPRFRRLIDEFALASGGPDRRVVIPFPGGRS
ncbi:MAG: hypothetical protein HY657_09645 [Acidobacteria bacterium]|nr:hypothetical protein [Acidobacteriota bacterium]